jgi:hypothetical protein
MIATISATADPYKIQTHLLKAGVRVFLSMHSVRENVEECHDDCGSEHSNHN